MDPRTLRSRRNLADAILRLSADRPADQITAAEVAAESGVNRSTFYQHARNPADLLAAVLRTELDDLRERHLTRLPGNASPAEVTAAIGLVTLGVFEHIDRHADVYRHGLGPDSSGASLHAMLGTHFQESVLWLLDRHNVELPQHDGTGMPAAVASRYIAYGTVGAIEAWLTDENRTVEGFLTDFSLLVPAWWPASAATA